MKNLLAIVRNLNQMESHLKFLKSMGNNLTAKVHLLYVENPADYYLGAPNITGVATATAQMSLKRRTQKAIENLGHLVGKTNNGADDGTTIEFSSEIGETIEVLEKHNSEMSEDMIVLKSDGNGSLWDRSDYEMRIIRHFDCPVWIIPEDTEFQPIDEIVYATDYHKEDLQTMLKLIRLTSKFSPNITALHVNTDDDFMARVEQSGFQEMIREKTSYDRIRVKVLQEKESHDMGLLINDFSTLVGAKLIVVLKENKHFLERIFNPDTSRRIIRQASIPVLVYHEQK